VDGSERERDYSFRRRREKDEEKELNEEDQGRECRGAGAREQVDDSVVSGSTASGFIRL